MRIMRTYILIAFFFVLLMWIGFIVRENFKFIDEHEQRACTMEAKICPDGTAVGRTGPNCEFAPCGNETIPVTERSRFFCENGDIIDIAFDKTELILTFSEHEYTLFQATSTLGVRFVSSDESVVFININNVASVEINGEHSASACTIPNIAYETENTTRQIEITGFAAGMTIESPLTINGTARGPWYFEANFPIVLTDWDGNIIAEHYATAEGEWMTEEFVPFTATLEFQPPNSRNNPKFDARGLLILKKANASGIPQYDDSVEIPVVFSP